MKMQNKTGRSTVALVLFSLLLMPCVDAYGSDFDGLENVVILTPNDENLSGTDTDTRQEGLVLSVNENSINRVDEVYSDIIFHVNLMNWATEEYQINDAIESKLYYQDVYEYNAKVDFSGETQIGMLVNLDGTITFTVPNIVAMAAEDELRLEMTVLDESYDEKINLDEAARQAFEETEMPFEYAMRNSDELEFRLGSAYMLDSWQGEKDEKYKWIVQEISLINWSQSQKDISDSLYSMLTYMDTYGFEAQVILPQEQLNTLEVIEGQLAYHIPLIVSTAEKDTLAIEIRLSDDIWSEAFDIDNMATDYWVLLSSVFPYESENAVNEIDEYAAETTPDIVSLENHFYLVINIAEPNGYYYRWDEAKEYCEQMGGHLATITSEEEQRIIQECLENAGEYKQYWIGGIKDENWEWITGENVEYSNWDSGQPSGNGGCLEIYNTGFWDDTNNEDYNVKGYICEWEF